MGSTCQSGGTRSLALFAFFALLLSAVAIACGLAPSLAQAAKGKAAPVRTASTDFRKGDRVKVVPVARKAWTNARSIMSLGPKQIGELAAGRRLEGSAEAELTICAKANAAHPGGGTPCVGRSYAYDPHLKMKLVIGSSAGATSRSTTIDIGPTRSITCSQHQPNRNRHCVIAIPWSGIKIPPASQLPCAPASCHLNLLVSANHSNARSGEVVVVGSSDDKKRIHQGRGKLSSILFTGDKRAVQSWKRSKPYKNKLKVGPDDSDGNPQVAYSLPVRGLKKGDQIIVDAESVTRIGSLPYNVTQRSSLIFARRPGSTKPAGKILGTNPRISADNGYGCTQGPSAHHDPCTVRKPGLLSVKKSSKKTWFINVVVSQEASDIAPKANKWRSRDRVRISKAGSIRAWKYRGSSVCATCSTGQFSFSPQNQPGSALYKRLVRSFEQFGITQGRYSCLNRAKGPHRQICSWQSEGRFGDSRRYECSSKAFLGRNKGNWQVKVCKDALGAQLWHLLQKRDISPTYTGGCKPASKQLFACKWFAKGERASGAYFCQGKGRYSTGSHSWNIDTCKNERENP